MKDEYLPAPVVAIPIIVLFAGILAFLLPPGVGIIIAALLFVSFAIFAVVMAPKRTERRGRRPF